jgi:hypothetical protein
VSSGFVNLSRPTLETTDVKHPQKVRLPSGYTLLAFPDIDATLQHSEDAIRVSIYPPGSDCIDQDDRVAELWMEREDVDVLLFMCGQPQMGVR